MYVGDIGVTTSNIDIHRTYRLSVNFRNQLIHKIGNNALLAFCFILDVNSNC